MGWPASKPWAQPPAPPPAELWYAGAAVCGLAHKQLQESANISPEIFAATPSLTQISDIALDGDGNVWAVGNGSDNVFRFRRDVLGVPPDGPNQPGSAEPDLIIQSASLKAPGNLAFDADGALWVANRQSAGGSATDNGFILKFDVPSGVSGMQSLDPAVQITSTTADDLFQIGGIAFDGAQDLWITSFVGLVRFDGPRGQTGHVQLTPSAVIDKMGYANDLYFYSVAFDTGGALWASSGDGLHYLTSVTEFKDPSSLMGRSSPTADATITGDADLLPAGGLAFDEAGNLWMATGESIVEYTDLADLSGVVNPPPAVALDLEGKAWPTTNTHLVFFPPPIPSQ